MVRPDQALAWEREYKTSQLLSPSNVPQADVMRFVRWLKKECRKRGERLDLRGMRVLDLGSGTGRNALYFAKEGAQVVGLEFAPTALALARAYAEECKIPIDYRLQSIAEPYPIQDASIDIALDVTSSNSLSDAERGAYLHELARVMKPGGFLFLRALSLEGDVHAKELIRRSPGPDPDTYVHPDLNLVEKTFTRETLFAAYEPVFQICEAKRTQHYVTVAGRTYKRSYWVAIMKRKDELK